MAIHNELGKFGEEKAVEYLLSKGYKIRDRNWKAGKYELDIVAEKDGQLVIVEVKTRSTSIFGNPEEFVNNTQIKRIIYAAQHYVFRYNIHFGTRFDIISILKIPDGNYEIKHIEDAFMPSWH
jgi:putative endonuclease